MAYTRILYKPQQHTAQALSNLPELKLVAVPAPETSTADLIALVRVMTQPKALEGAVAIFDFRLELGKVQRTRAPIDAGRTHLALDFDDHHMSRFPFTRVCVKQCTHAHAA
jgi:hypothetical protein